MSVFFTSFIDELTKIAKEDGGEAWHPTGKEKESTIDKLVHHPATQAAGYGALAGEGAHLLAEQGTLGRRVQGAAHTRFGRAAGTGALIGGTAFLAAEGIKALKDALKKDDDKKGHKKEAAKKTEKDSKKSKRTDDDFRRWVMSMQRYAEERLQAAASPDGRRRAMQRRMMWGR